MPTVGPTLGWALSQTLIPHNRPAGWVHSSPQHQRWRKWGSETPCDTQLGEIKGRIRSKGHLTWKTSVFPLPWGSSVWPEIQSRSPLLQAQHLARGQSPSRGSVNVRQTWEWVNEGLSLLQDAMLLFWDIEKGVGADIVGPPPSATPAPRAT